VFAAISTAVVGIGGLFSTNAFAQAGAAVPTGPAAAAADAAGAAPTTPAKAESDGSSSAAPAGDASSGAGASTSSGSGLFESSQTSADQGAGAGAAAGTGAEGGGGGLPFDFNGYVRGDVFAGKAEGESAGEMKAAYGELSLKITTKKLKYGDAFAEARLRYGLQQSTRIQLVDLREAYVNLYAGPLDLRLGQQIIVWGRADAVNPTNNLTPVDLRVHSPNEDDRRIGNIAARAFLNFQPVRIEGVWVPLYVPSELPDVRPEGARFVNPVFPSAHLSHGTGAGRVHLELPAIEMSASYLYGYAPLPGLEYAGNYVTGQNAAIDIRRHAYTQHVVGADFSTTLGDWLGLRGEAAYRRPLHYETRPYVARPDLMYVLGVDHTFDTVSVIAQYVGKYTFDWQAPPPLTGSIQDLVDAGPDSDMSHTAVLDQSVADAAPRAIYPHNQQIFGQEKQVQHMASLRVEWLTAHQTLSLSALALVNFSTQEVVAFPKVAYQFSDNFTGTIGGEIYGGPKDTLFGSISGNMSAAYAELKFSY
jgi:hypothetical protein